MTRRTRAKDLRRKTGTRPELKTIVVFCEGEASEPDYVNGLKRLPEVRGNASIKIEVDPGGGVPLTLVTRAMERSRDGEIDECWCVFDVEWPRNHPHLAEAVALAERNGIRVAVSNPSFELWLILHFEDCTAFLTSSAAERRSRVLDGRPGKRVDPIVYMSRRQAAVLRASALADRHSQNSTVFPRDNPSSTVGALLASVGAVP